MTGIDQKLNQVGKEVRRYSEQEKWLKDLRVTKQAIKECDDIDEFQSSVETLPATTTETHRANFTLRHDNFDDVAQFVEARDWDGVKTTTPKHGRKYRTKLTQDR